MLSSLVRMSDFSHHPHSASAFTATASSSVPSPSSPSSGAVAASAPSPPSLPIQPTTAADLTRAASSSRKRSFESEVGALDTTSAMDPAMSDAEQLPDSSFVSIKKAKFDGSAAAAASLLTDSMSSSAEANHGSGDAGHEDASGYSDAVDSGDEKADEELWPPAPLAVDLSSEDARRRRQVCLSHADTVAELASLNKDSLHAIRLNELRVCFQLNHAELGLPLMRTDLLSLVNDYCAPLESGDCRRVSAVACWNGFNLFWYSEYQFRRLAKRTLLKETEVLKFMRWRENAWAKRHEAAVAPDAPPCADGASLEQLEEEEGEGEEEAVEKEDARRTRLEAELFAALCAEMRQRMAGASSSSDPGAYQREWNHAFSQAWTDCRRGFVNENLKGWIRGVHSSVDEWMRAADPHCDIEELARMYNESVAARLQGYGNGNLRADVGIVYADESPYLHEDYFYLQPDDESDID